MIIFQNRLEAVMQAFIVLLGRKRKILDLVRKAITVQPYVAHFDPIFIPYFSLLSHCFFLFIFLSISPYFLC